MGPHLPVVSTDDANGNTVTVTDQRGKQIKTEYDSRNNPVKVTAVAFEDGHGTVANRMSSEQFFNPDGTVGWRKRWLSATSWVQENWTAAAFSDSWVYAASVLFSHACRASRGVVYPFLECIRRRL